MFGGGFGAGLAESLDDRIKQNQKDVKEALEKHTERVWDWSKQIKTDRYTMKRDLRKLAKTFQGLGFTDQQTGVFLKAGPEEAQRILNDFTYMSKIDPDFRQNALENLVRIDKDSLDPNFDLDAYINRNLVGTADASASMDMPVEGGFLSRGVINKYKKQMAGMPGMGEAYALHSGIDLPEVKGVGLGSIDYTMLGDKERVARDQSVATLERTELTNTDLKNLMSGKVLKQEVEILDKLVPMATKLEDQPGQSVNAARRGLALLNSADLTSGQGAKTIYSSIIQNLEVAGDSAMYVSKDPPTYGNLEKVRSEIYPDLYSSFGVTLEQNANGDYNYLDPGAQGEGISYARMASDRAIDHYTDMVTKQGIGHAEAIAIIRANMDNLDPNNVDPAYKELLKNNAFSYGRAEEVPVGTPPNPAAKRFQSGGKTYQFVKGNYKFRNSDSQVAFVRARTDRMWKRLHQWWKINNSKFKGIPDPLSVKNPRVRQSSVRQVPSLGSRRPKTIRRTE